MIAPEKPPLRMANTASSFFSWRVLKFGPFVRSPPRISRLDFDPVAAAESSVWQPEQRRLNSTAPAWSRSWDCGTSMLLPHAERVITAIRAATSVRLRRVTGAHLTRQEAQTARRKPERPGGGGTALHSTAFLHRRRSPPPGPNHPDALRSG